MAVLIPISLLPITACVDLHVIIMEINYLLTMILLPFKIISPRKRCKRYDAIDINVYQANLFHTKLLIKEIELQNYLFNTDVYELSPKERLAITDRLRREMIEIFSGTNVYK